MNNLFSIEMLHIKKVIKEDPNCRILRGTLNGANVIVEIWATNQKFQHELEVLK